MYTFEEKSHTPEADLVAKGIYPIASAHIALQCYAKLLLSFRMSYITAATMPAANASIEPAHCVSARTAAPVNEAGFAVLLPLAALLPAAPLPVALALAMAAAALFPPYWMG